MGYTLRDLLSVTWHGAYFTRQRGFSVFRSNSGVRSTALLLYILCFAPFVVVVLNARTGVAPRPDDSQWAAIGELPHERTLLIAFALQYDGNYALLVGL